MSALPKSHSLIGNDYAGLRMTAEEYLALGETDKRYELIDGVVFMSPAPTTRHQKVLRLILRELETSIGASAGVEILPDVDVRLTRGKVYRPDISLVAAGRLKVLPDKLTIAPDLIIEILSEGTKSLDLITKRDDYEAFGVREYWVIDQETITARVWRRDGEKLIEVGSESGVVESSAIAGASVNLTRVRASVGPMSVE